MEFQRVFTGAPWESKAGYCRALRAGPMIFVTGTTSIDSEGHVFAKENAYEQAKRCLEIIEGALKKLGADRKNIARTRMFVTDISQWQEFAKAHREFFEDHPPTTSMIEISKLVDSEMLIEIEADAFVG